MPPKTQVLDEKLAHLDILDPVTVEGSATYQECLEVMRKNGRGAVIVCKKGKVAGVFTERDVLYKHLLEGIAVSTPVSKLMTPGPVTVTLETTLGRAVELMHEKGVRNLPLVDKDGRPKKILTIGRVLKYLADHYQAEVVNLPPVLHQMSEETEGA